MTQHFDSDPHEAFWGLGQQQIERMNYKGLSLDLSQTNKTIVIPLLLSSRGYGLFWNHFSHCAFGTPHSPIAPDYWQNDDGEQRGLTMTTFDDPNFDNIKSRETVPTIDFTWKSNTFGVTDDSQDTPFAVRFTGTLTPPVSGDYILRPESPMHTRIWLNDECVIDEEQATFQTILALEGGRAYRFKMETPQNVNWVGAMARLYWGIPQSDHEYSLWCKDTAQMDYVFVGGETPKSVIANYYTITGSAPLFPKWAYGLWQCKEHYQSSAELLDIAHTYREKGIPLDAIIQDWRYWGKYGWGAHLFDETRYPAPKTLVDQLHQQHVNIMLSVWAEFDPITDNHQEFAAKGWLLPNAFRSGNQYFGAFNPEAGKLYWDQFKRKLYPHGFDGWWLDSTEPECFHPLTTNQLADILHPNAMGTGSRHSNCYSTFSNQYVAEGFRDANDGRRVFILSRSGFAGQQRLGSCIWSGDIHATWQTLREQVTCGVNTSMSGYPYWNSDIGGFLTNNDPDTDAYRELFTRWFQFGAFSPMFRIHGSSYPREPWRFGEEIEAILVRYDLLRYRLMPYIYSIAGATTHDKATLLRGLSYEFPDQPAGFDITDQFMFGPALMVCPVVHQGATTRQIYLPDGTAWYDFFSGRQYDGGQTITVDAPSAIFPCSCELAPSYRSAPKFSMSTKSQPTQSSCASTLAPMEPFPSMRTAEMATTMNTVPTAASLSRGTMMDVN